MTKPKNLKGSRCWSNLYRGTHCLVFFPSSFIIWQIKRLFGYLLSLLSAGRQANCAASCLNPAGHASIGSKSRNFRNGLPNLPPGAGFSTSHTGTWFANLFLPAATIAHFPAASCGILSCSLFKTFNFPSSAAISCSNLFFALFKSFWSRFNSFSRPSSSPLSKPLIFNFSLRLSTLSCAASAFACAAALAASTSSFVGHCCVVPQKPTLAPFTHGCLLKSKALFFSFKSRAASIRSSLPNALICFPSCSNCGSSALISLFTLARSASADSFFASIGALLSCIPSRNTHLNFSSSCLKAASLLNLISLSLRTLAGSPLCAIATLSPK